MLWDWSLGPQGSAVCFPRTRRGTLGGAACFFFFISCHSFAHFLRCSCQVVILYDTSTFWAEVARDIPTYSLRRQNIGESVSSSRTTPGRVSPCTLA